MLTSKQRDLLVFIHERLENDGVSPSFDEMKLALGLKSKSGVHRLITALEERGFLRRLAHRARALEVLRLPDDYAAKEIQPVVNRRVQELTTDPAEVMRSSASVLQMGMGGGQASRSVFGASTMGALDSMSAGTMGSAANSNQAPLAGDSPWGSQGLTQVPMLGKIAAGLPMESINDTSTPTIGVPHEMMGQGEYYALEVDGDSMIEAGIHDGDHVIIRRSEHASNGDIVVAVVEGYEVTLKTYRRSNDVVALEPANRDFEVQMYPANQVSIQGRLAGLMRRY